MLSFVLVLPLLLTSFSTQEIAVWYLFSAVLALQVIVDFGFAPTFSRAISYAMGGAESAQLLLSEPSGSRGGPNWPLVERLMDTMRITYRRMAAPAVLLVALLATPALMRHVERLPQPGLGWIAWTVVLVAMYTAFRASYFSAFLQGINEVALYRRWEAITGVGATMTSIGVLLAGGGLLSLVIASQAWVVIAAGRDRWLARSVANGRLRQFQSGPLDKELLNQLWPGVWRSGIGVGLGRALVWASGLLVAQVSDAAGVAMYLLALRLVTTLADFSSVPLYSKLPMLSRLRAEGDQDRLLSVVERGMGFGLWLFVAGGAVLGAVGAPLLIAIGSNAPFVPESLWLLLLVAFFVERYGAFHIQIYTTTNHIIWHVATGVTGTLYIVLALAFLRPLGLYAFPLAILISYASFYSWYAAYHVYKMMPTTFWPLQRKAALGPAVALALYCVITAAMGAAG